MHCVEFEEGEALSHRLRTDRCCVSFVGSTRVEKGRRGTVAADFHHVLDQALDRLVLAQLSFETFEKMVTTSVSVSPVRCAGVRASRSASGSLILRGMKHLGGLLSA
jgi:hypothetical protein